MKPANLLAKKCLINPQSEEVEALLTLVEQGSLDIDWLKPVERGQSLLELGLKNVKEVPLVEKMLTLATKHHSLSLTSSVGGTHSQALATVLFSSSHLWRLGNSLLKQNPLSEQDWDDLLKTAPFQMHVLSDYYPRWKDQVTPLSDKQLAKFEKYREDNLWMSQNDYTSFAQHVPKNITPEQLLNWTLLSLPQIKSQKDYWRLKVVAHNKDKLWEKWSQEDWMTVWESQPKAGFLLALARSGGTVSPSFLKAYTPNASTRATYIFSKELNAVVQNLSDMKGQYSGGNAYAQTESMMKMGSRFLSEWADKVFPPNSPSFAKGLYLGLLQNTKTSTKFDQDAINEWKNVSFTHIDDFVEKIKQSLPDGHSKVQSFWLHPDLLAYFIHQYTQSQTGKDNLKPFVSSINFDTLSSRTVPKEQQEAVALKLVQVGSRIAQDTSSPKDVEKAGSEMFWRSVFLIPAANQHYWMKKASGMPSLSQKLDFWNDDFHKKLEDATNSKKRTKEIVSLLTKLSLNNLINTEGSQTTVKKSRKM